MRMTKNVGMIFIREILGLAVMPSSQYMDNRIRSREKVLYKAHDKYFRPLLMAYPHFTAGSGQLLASREVAVTEAGKSRTSAADNV